MDNNDIQKRTPSVVTVVSAATLKKLYDVLEDEAEPYEMRVRKLGAQHKNGSIIVDITAMNLAYFTELIQRMRL